MITMRISTLLVLVILSGCSPGALDSAADARAQRSLQTADSLDRANSLAEASLAYALIAEQYPGTPSGQTAACNAALLYSDPMNSAANDSIALFWFTRCSRMQVQGTNGRTVRVASSLFDRIRILRDESVRLAASNDALSAQTKRLNGTVGNQSKRIQDLEQELRRTGKELKSLKEVDLRMSRSRQKK